MKLIYNLTYLLIAISFTRKIIARLIQKDDSSNFIPNTLCYAQFKDYIIVIGYAQSHRQAIELFNSTSRWCLSYVDYDGTGYLIDRGPAYSCYEPYKIPVYADGEYESHKEKDIEAARAAHCPPATLARLCTLVYQKGLKYG